MRSASTATSQPWPATASSGVLVLVLLLWATLSSLGCRRAPNAAAAVVDGLPDRMTSCQELETVTGTSRLESTDTRLLMADAKLDARGRAGALGATHVVWLSESFGAQATVVATPYRCPPVATPAVKAPDAASR